MIKDSLQNNKVKFLFDPIPNKRSIKPTEKMLIANVRFGSIKDQCLGHGICTIVPLKEKQFQNFNPLNGNYALAFIQIFETKNQAVFQFLKESIDKNIKSIYFNQNTFLMEAEFNLQQIFTSKKTRIIKPGKYSVLPVIGGDLSVTFPI